ncbi:hypothetical protein EDB85DRAFT_2148055 [Lactarius pseudohatsudake]|nr:hypothetical protein EDB85DRAFT_2148055 [Lactarius pseudohatsudake]
MQESSPTPPATPSRAPPSAKRTPLLIHIDTPDAQVPHTHAMRHADEQTPPARNAPFPPTFPGLSDAPPLPPSLPPILDTSSTKSRLEAAAGRNNIPSSKFTPRNALDKYTAGPLPPVHDAHPTAVFTHIDLDLITEWESHKNDGLLAHPFDADALKSTTHEATRELIFTAVSEITKSLEVEVSAPMPGNAAESNGKPQPPNVFLIYNLTKEQMQLLLHRSVWSSLAITFRTLPFSPPCPNFLFSIRGFSTHLESTVTTIIQQVWDCNNTKMYTTSLINAVPEDKRGVTEAALGLFFDSMWVKRLDIRRAGDTLVPRFNIYADSSAIPIDEVWIRLREYLVTCEYHAHMQGYGITDASPYHCGVCHGADHPRGLCPFPDTPGWNGPSKRPNTENAGRRSSRTFGTGARIR